MLTGQPADRPAPGTAVVTDKGLSGGDTEEFFSSPGLDLALILPARKDEKTPRIFPNWLRQRVEAIIRTLKNQLGLERHGGRVPAGLWARIVHRCSPSTPRSGSPGRSVRRSSAPSSPTITDLPLFPGHRSRVVVRANEVPRGFRTVRPLGWTIWKG
jgi:hypothetical protein